MSRMARLCNTLGFLIIVVIIVLLLPTIVLPRVGIQLYEVVTGSMEPEIPTGSLVSVSKAELEQIAPGDIITFSGGGLGRDAIVTHRVVLNDGESRTIITKGDANRTEDPYPISYDQVIGQVKWHLPILGKIYGFFSTPKGRLFGAVGIFVGIACFGIETIIKKETHKKKGR